MLLKSMLAKYQDFHEMTIPAYIDFISTQERPFRDNLNPFKWIIWHMARGEDFGSNRLVSNSPQIYHSKKWDEKLGVKTTLLGTGMTKEEVFEINDNLDLQILDEYRREVYQAYRNLMLEIETHRLEEKKRRGLSEKRFL